jgi:diguanylate cyclase (GGDEF)-like protein/PAS domain S-box-containing protein
MGLPGAAARLLEDFTTFEELPVAMSLVSCDGRLLRANAAMGRLLGRSEPDLLGADALDLVHPAERARARALLADVVAGREDGCAREGRYVRPDGAEVAVLVRRTAVRDAQGPVALVVEHAAGRSWPDPQALLTTAARRSEILLRLADRLASDGRDPGTVADAAARAVQDLLDGGVAVFFVDPGDPAVLEAAAVRTGTAAAEDELRRLLAQQPLRTDVGVLGQACRAGRALLVQDPWEGEGPSPVLTEYASWLAANPVRAALLVPLQWEGRVLGLLAAGRHRPPTYTADEVSYAEQVARQVSTVLADVQLVALERSTVRRERAVSAVTQRCDEAIDEPTGVLAAAVRAVGQELGGACAAWLLDERCAERLGRGAVSHPDPSVEAVLRPVLQLCAEAAPAFLSQVLTDGRALVVGRDRVAAHAAAEPALRPHAGVIAVESLYGVRLTARGQALGLLVFGHLTDRLSVEDRRLVDALADRVALALGNAALLAAARSTRSRTRALVEHCSDMLLLVDRDGVVRYASPAAARTFGRGRGDDLLAPVAHKDRAAVRQAWRAALQRPGLSPPIDVDARDTTGRLRRLSAVANNLLDDPAVDGLVLTVRDVTDERAAISRLAERAGQQAALAAIGATALTAPLDELYRFVGKAIAETLESTGSGVLRRLDPGGAARRWETLGGSDDRHLGTVIEVTPTAGLARVAATAWPVLVEDYLVSDVVDEPEATEVYGVRSGVLAPVLVRGTVWGAVAALNEQPGRFSTVDLDFLQTVATVLAGAVERTEMSDRVLRQATTDELTGLPNRVFVQGHLRELLAGMPAGADPVALLLLDLDDFKDVNDSLGHGAGDQVLAQLGHRLADVVGSRGTVGRLGGDEFAVCLAGPDAAAHARRLAEDVARSLGEPFALPAIDVTLSTSIGIALAPMHGSDPEQLLQSADMAMYRAKAERSGWACYDVDLDSTRSERLTLLSELRVALSSGQLALHYQPLVDLATDRVVEVEALLRWHHPERGLLLPAAFLPPPSRPTWRTP